MELPVAERIVELRGERIILDSDLAGIYGVTTKVLNQTVKRNAERFPSDFAIRLNRTEIEATRRSRSQLVTLKRGQNVKYLPWAFTEHGALMAASLLNSARAVEMSVFVIRAFVRLRDLARTHARLAVSLSVLERRVTEHDRELKEVIAALRALIQPRPGSRRRIGFHGQGN